MKSLRNSLQNKKDKNGKETEKMAESMQGLKRSHRCTEVSSANIGEVVTVMGWVQKKKKFRKSDLCRFKGPLRTLTDCL